MMRCRDVRGKLSEFLDGELDERTRDEIRRHLEICEECAREYDGILEAVSLVRNLPEIEPPKDMWMTLKTRLEGVEGLRFTWPERLKRLIAPPLARHPAFAPLILLILVGMFAVVGWWTFMRSGSDIPEMQLLSLYVQEHARYLRQMPASDLFLGSEVVQELKAPVKFGETGSGYELQTYISLYYEGE
ncbi:TPA: hypothetical protein EYP37_11800 [Candidatus Poribacteria bacterium]|nr:hypothetical protein [Candidatus Poribacteria bacterium]